MKNRVHILGGGESGVWAAILATKNGYQVQLIDQQNIQDERKQFLKEQSIAYIENTDLETLDLLDLLIVSPGVSESNALVRRYREAAIAVIGEMEFAYRFNEKKIIAITGSNGKTTTTKLIHHLLTSAGISASIGGNYGRCFSHLLIEEPDSELYVLEVSSFQLDTINKFRPNVALLLNITPDHLDRYHYSMDLYVRSKFRITENQLSDDRFIVNDSNLEIQEYLDHHQVQANIKRINNACLTETGFRDSDMGFFDLTHSRLKGKHNQLNAAFAVAAVSEWINDKATLGSALSTFVNDPHRMELVRELNGTLYINDSKATNVDSVFYALESMERPVIWLVGGQDKGNDYTVLDNLMSNKVKAIICIGADNEKLLKYFSQFDVDIFSYNDMEKGVKQASKIAGKGDVVLLSPACASFDLFQNYMDRGDRFKKAVNLL
jgi:UDP-N-acetylmuramoylalanine--D-glutamate ligase